MDLSCLDFNDAIAITKQKVYDLAKHVSMRNPKNAFNHTDGNYVLNIKCADDHVILMENEQGKEVPKNGILDMIRNDMNLDHHYIPSSLTILVRVTYQTLNIPMFGGGLD